MLPMIISSASALNLFSLSTNNKSEDNYFGFDS